MGDFDPHDGTLIDDDRACKIAQIALEGLPDGWILDGLPRRIKQYKSMLELFRPTFFIILNVSRDLSVARIQKRLQTDPRKDDAPDILLKRLDIFDKETMPVIEDIIKPSSGKRHIVINQTSDTTPSAVEDAVDAYIKVLRATGVTRDKFVSSISPQP